MNATELLVMECAHRSGQETIACRKCGTRVIKNHPEQTLCLWCDPEKGFYSGHEDYTDRNAGVQQSQCSQCRQCRQCRQCGAVILTQMHGRHRKYCEACRAQRHREQSAAWDKKRRGLA